MLTEESLLQFPCDFPIKAMGHSGPDFQQLVIGIIERHAPDLDRATLRVQPSRHGRYESVTLTVCASSRAQLDAIYQELSVHERVLVAL